MTDEKKPIDVDSLTETFTLENVSTEAIWMLADLIEVAADMENKSELVYDSRINNKSFEHFIHYVAKGWLNERAYQRDISDNRRQLAAGVRYDDVPLFDATKEPDI